MSVRIGLRCQRLLRIRVLRVHVLYGYFRSGNANSGGFRNNAIHRAVHRIGNRLPPQAGNQAEQCRYSQAGSDR